MIHLCLWVHCPGAAEGESNTLLCSCVCVITFTALSVYTSVEGNLATSTKSRLHVACSLISDSTNPVAFLVLTYSTDWHQTWLMSSVLHEVELDESSLPLQTSSWHVRETWMYPHLHVKTCPIVASEITYQAVGSNQNSWTLSMFHSSTWGFFRTGVHTRAALW